VTDSEEAPSFEAEIDFWDECSLTTVLTDPPQHELTLPGSQVVRLRTASFFNVSAFVIAYVDSVGAFPPLPDKKPGAFLRDLFRRLLADRKTVALADEASDRGTLLDDIRRALCAVPSSDDPADIERGAMFESEDAGHLVSARSLLHRVSRDCPVRFRVTDFYAALATLGLSNLGKKRFGVRTARVWAVPKDLVPEIVVPAVHANGSARPVLPEPGSDPDAQGAFDDLLNH
jgi:hypothetical protein